MKAKMGRVLRSMRRVVKFLVLAVIIATVVYQVKFKPVPVQRFSVERREIVVESMGTGTLEARVQMTISAEISGRIQEILTAEGESVEAGETLVRLYEDELVQQVEIAQATVEANQATWDRTQADCSRAEAILELAERSLARVDALIESNAISASDQDEAIRDVAVAQADVTHANAAAIEAERGIAKARKTQAFHQSQREEARITAPFDGLVIRRSRELGDVVVPGTPILTLISMEELWISAWVDETEMARLETGQTSRVVFRSEPDTSYQGEVARLGKEADRQTREFIVDVRVLELPKNWAVGQRVEVFIETGRRTDVLAIPNRAVQWRERTPGVFIERAGCALWQPVKLGARDSEHVEILQGLEQGDAVVLSQKPKTELTDGKRIAVQ